MYAVIVEMTIVVATYTAAFPSPKTLDMASQFGRLSPGPASNSPRVGPFPMPSVISVFTNGAPVIVAK